MNSVISCLFVGKKKLQAGASASVSLGHQDEQHPNDTRGQPGGAQNKTAQDSKDIRGYFHPRGKRTFVYKESSLSPGLAVSCSTLGNGRDDFDQHTANLCRELRGQINSAIMQFEEGISRTHGRDGTAASARIAAAPSGGLIAQEQSHYTSRVWPPSTELVTFAPATTPGPAVESAAGGLFQHTSEAAEASSSFLQPQQPETLSQVGPCDLLQPSSLSVGLPSPHGLQHWVARSSQHSTSRAPSRQASVAPGECTPQGLPSSRASSQHCIHRSPLREHGLHIDTFHSVDATSANKMVQQLYEGMEDSTQLQVCDSSNSLCR